MESPGVMETLEFHVLFILWQGSRKCAPLSCPGPYSPNLLVYPGPISIHSDDAILLLQFTSKERAPEAVSSMQARIEQPKSVQSSRGRSSAFLK